MMKGPERMRRGKGSGRGSGPNRKRTETIADVFRGVRTRKRSLWDEDRPATFLPRGPEIAIYPPREWFARNAGELLLGLGWQSLEDRTLWTSTRTTEASGRLLDDLRNCFALEFPIATSWIADKYEFDLCRVYPARIEMEGCRKAHRVAILDLARENRLREDRRNDSMRDDLFELLVERWCPCFWEGERPHDGDLYVYRWR